ncbi:Zinc finger A20 and AN1 domain-containing stress-associated protein 10 [Raphanus sativus]|uniref:Zinc finger A20 and AN1 domain-containing stress-associated protein 10 n=1 Tax=Raphanus sativus TaxID=3726 RepID=A0A6J0NB87_RAPSA|nr:zinc finger A20 and AN1 domain-containing stress-associated protein 10 [Raphanus sativus]XP_056862944.1 zinc finger A20 and AN1 domain-containing stress-associated protein 10-like [Raphanus sativus]KAJ4899508.1 Zinc finger A20 and AN1 domain-containing stress-associated protein 10 [Raphanus sativus]
MMHAYETEALPCAGGCGLFGTRQNNNLCSLCYKKSVLEQLAALKLEPKPEPSTVVPTTSPIIAAVEEPVRKQRCETCHRKVGVTGFSCKCGHIFCGSHRYPEEHSCSFDYKLSGRLALEKQLPLIRAEKFVRFQS